MNILNTSIFILVVLVILYIKYQLGGKIKPFWGGLKSISTWVIAIVLHVVLTLVIAFFTVEYRLENFYSDLKDKNDPKMVFERPLVFESIPKPDYIGDSSTASTIQIGDTIRPLASFNKGKGLTGDKYLLTECNGVQYWIAEKSLMSLFEYTYTFQPLSFTISDTEKVDQAWENAKSYMTLYRKYHGSDISDVLINDTILYAKNARNTGDQFLEIKRKPTTKGFEFSISAALYKGKESCVVKGVEDKSGNKPRNDQACAYYITHGSFYKETELISATQ